MVVIKKVAVFDSYNELSVGTNISEAFKIAEERNIYYVYFNDFMYVRPKKHISSGDDWTTKWFKLPGEVIYE